MEINIKKERETPLLARKRYVLEVVKEGPTPSRLEMVNIVSAKLKSDPKLTIIKHVYPRYGVQKTRAVVHVYDTKEDMARYEMEGLIKKHEAKKEEPKKEEAAPAPAEKKEEAPAEKKEDAKEEAPAEAAAE